MFVSKLPQITYETNGIFQAIFENHKQPESVFLRVLRARDLSLKIIQKRSHMSLKIFSHGEQNSISH